VSKFFSALKINISLIRFQLFHTFHFTKSLNYK